MVFTRRPRAKKYQKLVNVCVGSGSKGTVTVIGLSGG